MNTVELASVLCDLAAPIASIMEDSEIMGILETMAQVDENPIAYAAKMVKKILPVALKKHQDSTFSIVAALTGKTLKQIREQKGLQTIKDAMSCMDADLWAFFASSNSTAQSAPLA